MKRKIAKHIHEWFNSDSSQGSTLMRPHNEREFIVWGHAFVPVEVRIKIKAKTAEIAMKMANLKLKKGIRAYIVPGSEDEGAAFGFDAINAEENPNESPEHE